MQLTLKRGSLLLGVLAALIVTMALASSSASASSQFCGGQLVNSWNKCWGASRSLQGATSKGESTGTCVGADLTQGTCAPTGSIAIVWVNPGVHSPWVIGTGSNFTYTYSWTID